MTEHPIETDDDSVLAAEYALGVLQGPARDEFAKRMSEDPALAAAVRDWSEHFASFAREIAPVDPPADLERRLEMRLFWARPTGLSLNLEQPSVLAWPRHGVLCRPPCSRTWTIATRLPSQQPALVAEVKGEAKDIELTAFYDAGKGELRFNRTAGQAATNRSLELWLIIGSDAPVSLGVLPAAPAASIVVPEKFRSKLKGSVLAISDEPAGGSPTGAPTGAVLGTGKLTDV